MTVEGITAAVAAFAAAPPLAPDSRLTDEAERVVAELRLAHPNAEDAALAAGAEIALRLEDALRGHVEGGWSATTAALVIASAVTGAVTLRLDARTAERAIGLAATQAAGLEGLKSGPLGAVQRAHAVRAGAEAAVLASAGVEGHLAALEGRRGLFALVALGADPSAVADGLGERWRSRATTTTTSTEWTSA